MPYYNRDPKRDRNFDNRPEIFHAFSMPCSHTVRKQGECATIEPANTRPICLVRFLTLGRLSLNPGVGKLHSKNSKSPSSKEKVSHAPDRDYPSKIHGTMFGRSYHQGRVLFN